MTRIFGILMMSLLATPCVAQQNPGDETEKRIFVKGNALFLPALILNFGIETEINEHVTWQNDFFLSPWKSINGNHALVLMAHTEGRYYFDSAFNKWYVGINLGSGIFDLTKWNYSGTHKFQRGYNVMIGGVVGYQYQWKERWNIDIFVGGGTIQSWYHGYAPTDTPPGFYRYDEAEYWNKSGEVLPYRGGIMLSYRLN